MRRTGSHPSFGSEARGLRFLGPVVAALVVLLLAACSAPARTPVTAPPGATSSIQPATTGTPVPLPSATTAESFPLTLTDDEQATVTIPAEPKRIVSLTPATTELLFELDLGDRVVGRVQDVSLYPPEAGPIPEVATFGAVDVEKIVGLEPDLVVAGGNNFNPPESVARLRTLGIPVLVVYASDVEGVFRDLELTARAVGRATEGSALVADLRGVFGTVASATKDVARPRVFYEIDATGAIYGPADKSFLAEMIRLAGGDPITTGSADKFDIPLERLIAADPQIILLGDSAYGVTAEQVAGRAGWNVMAAVRDAGIRPIDDVVVTRPGPRLGEGLLSLVEAIHPDLEIR